MSPKLFSPRVPSAWTARDTRPHGRRPRHGLHPSIAACSGALSGSSHGRGLLQVYGHAVRLQALSLGGSAGLQLRSSVPARVLEARGEGPTGGLPSLQRTQTRGLLPTHGLCLSVLPGVHEREPADLLRVPQPDEPELCSGDSGAGRRAEVGDMTAGLQVSRGVSGAGMGALSVGSAGGQGSGARVQGRRLRGFPFLYCFCRILPHVKSTGSRVTEAGFVRIFVQYLSLSFISSREFSHLNTENSPQNSNCTHPI